ncbi:hypothetical protein WJX74_002951 [Apatococcus lobatus]|uniref:PDZ domain-containing protein n=2 Tax=Apatococcus TaxID=904362 RepID=A0AAW1RAU8_9CHLO
MKGQTAQKVQQAGELKPSEVAASPGKRKPQEDPETAEQRPARRSRVPKAPEAGNAEKQDARSKRRKVHGPGEGTATEDVGAADLGTQSPLHIAPEAFAAALEQKALGAEKLMECVVKVFCTHSEPNYSLPWQRKRQYTSTSSGFVIDGNRILTNAHSVDHHTQVKVRRRGSDTKYMAKVLAVGAECDIAMLTVADKAFWENATPVVFGQLPRLQEAVSVIGYPIGGETLSVTSGVVSRIEVTSYVHGTAELLGIQTDSAINSGNSGGPAFNGRGQCVGIAFQSLKHDEAENIGYVIPQPVIEHFISDFERNKKYTAFPLLGIEWQKTENPYLRKALGMKEGQKGVLIRRVEPTSPAIKALEKGDVLLSFDGNDIASDGTVPFRSGERISFSYLVSLKFTGDQAKLQVLHKGKAKTVTVTLALPARLIPVQGGRPPSYFIIAGLVFLQATVPYLRSEYGKDFDFEAPVKLLDKMLHGMASHEGQQVVVLSQVLASEISVGYEEIVNTQVLCVNGHKISNLKELVQHVDGSKGVYLRLELDYDQVVILETSAARAATAELLQTHCIPSDRSVDLGGTAPPVGQPPA